MERIADLLARQSPRFNSVALHCPVSDALYQLTCENADFLMVVEDDAFRGVITDHDIASRILFEHRPLKEIEVREFMNTSLPIASPEDSLQSCLQLMERFNTRQVAVYDRFDFCGVVSADDLMQEALHNGDYFAAEGADPRRGYPWTY